MHASGEKGAGPKGCKASQDQLAFIYIYARIGVSARIMGGIFDLATKKGK
jgi:hypothetical protein